MPTEPVARFTLQGREFLVLWKETAAYLRADGHMWGGSLGAGLSREEAERLARQRAAAMLEYEREQEGGQIHLLYLGDPPPHAARVMNNYRKLRLELGDQTFPVVWADFNQNVWLCAAEGWLFAGNAADPDAALAAARALAVSLPDDRRRAGRPDAPPEPPTSEEPPPPSQQQPPSPEQPPAPAPTPTPTPTSASGPPNRTWIWRSALLALIAAPVGLGVALGKIAAPGDALGFLLGVLGPALLATVVGLAPLALFKHSSPRTVDDPLVSAVAVGGLALSSALFHGGAWIAPEAAFAVWGAFVVACHLIDRRALARRDRRMRAAFRLDQFWDAALDAMGGMLNADHRATTSSCGVSFADPAWPGRTVVWGPTQLEALFAPRRTVVATLNENDRPLGRLLFAFDAAAAALTCDLCGERAGDEGLRGVVARMVSPLAGAYQSLDAPDAPQSGPVVMAGEGRPWAQGALRLGVLNWPAGPGRGEVMVGVAIDDALLRRLLAHDDARRDPGTAEFHLTAKVERARAAFADFLAQRETTG